MPKSVVKIPRTSHIIPKRSASSRPGCPAVLRARVARIPRADHSSLVSMNEHAALIDHLPAPDGGEAHKKRDTPRPSLTEGDTGRSCD